MVLMPVVVALDPGGTTGFVIWNSDSLDSVTPFWCGPQDHHLDLYEHLEHITSLWPTTIVCESFEFRQGARDNLVLASVEYIGVVKLACERAEKKATLHMQTAAQAKGFISDKNLEKAGLLFTPKTKWPNQHLNDALRHLCYYRVTALKDTELLRRMKQ